MSKKMINYERQYKNSVAKMNIFKNRLQYVTKKLEMYENNIAILNSVSNSDKIKAMNWKSTKFMKWLNCTITKALKFKFSYGNNGYKELFRQKNSIAIFKNIAKKNLKLKI
jgi:hypothetical protein